MLTVLTIIIQFKNKFLLSMSEFTVFLMSKKQFIAYRYSSLLKKKKRDQVHSSADSSSPKPLEQNDKRRHDFFYRASLNLM